MKRVWSREGVEGSSIINYPSKTPCLLPSPTQPPGVDCVYRDRGRPNAESQQRDWWVFDRELVLPEYILTFCYTSPVGLGVLCVCVCVAYDVCMVCVWCVCVVCVCVWCMVCVGCVRVWCVMCVHVWGPCMDVAMYGCGHNDLSMSTAAPSRPIGAGVPTGQAN